MILPVYEQLRLFFITILYGLCLGFFYDVLRFFRKMIYHNSVLNQLEDIIFWIVASFGMFLLLLVENYGEVRLFMLVGAFGGVCVYFFIISPVLEILVGPIIKIRKKVLKKLSFCAKIVGRRIAVPITMVYKAGVDKIVKRKEKKQRKNKSD